MDNPFKQIEPKDSLPKEAKQQALGNIYSIKFVMDVLDLFLAKFGATAGESFSTEIDSPPIDQHSQDSTKRLES
ncbi:MAG: hypothetical protein AAF587_24745 [Bacteroidota bacterium]